MPVARGPFVSTWLDEPDRDAGISGSRVWAAPPGGRLLVDLRTFGQMIVKPGSVSVGDPGPGVAVFHFDGPIPVGYTPSPADLDDVWDELTVGADPTHLSGPKPIMCGVRGRRELMVPWDHSLDRFEALRVPDGPMLGVIRIDYARIRARALDPFDRADAELHLRYLGHQERKYRGLDYRDVSVAQGLPDEGTRPPTTTLSDDFNRGDESLQSGSWVVVTGTWSIETNEVRTNQNGASGPRSARRSDSLSTDDHYGEVLFTTQENEFSWMGGTARHSGTSSADATFYYGLVRTRDSNRSLNKVINDSGTELDSDTSGGGPPQLMRTQADGSTIKLFDDGAEIFSVTDTAITGDLTPGIGAHVSNDSFGDDFLAEDLAVEEVQALQMMGRAGA